MRRHNRFRPMIERLESLQLLASYTASIARFVGAIERDSSDATLHTAWGFPGMIVNLQVEKPASYMGLKQVEYTFSKPVLDTDPSHRLSGNNEAA